jgi:hypothetical protein
MHGLIGAEAISASRLVPCRAVSRRVWRNVFNTKYFLHLGSDKFLFGVLFHLIFTCLYWSQFGLRQAHSSICFWWLVGVEQAVFAHVDDLGDQKPAAAWQDELVLVVAARLAVREVVRRHAVRACWHAHVKERLAPRAVPADGGKGLGDFAGRRRRHKAFVRDDGPAPWRPAWCHGTRTRQPR